MSNSLADALSHLPSDERQTTYALPKTSIRHNHGHSWDETNFQNNTDSKGQGALEHVQGGVKPFEITQGDQQSSAVRYQRSYDLSDNLRNYDSLNTLSVDTYPLVMDPLDHFHSLAAEDDLIDCFLYLPVSENIPFVLSYETIAQAQPGDAQLQQLHKKKPNKFIQRLLAPNTILWCYQATQDEPWRIYLPEALFTRAVQWYHHALSHVGQNRLMDTMSMTFYSPLLRNTVEAVVLPCAPCQRYKNVQRGHGATAPREADILPWNHVAVDTIVRTDKDVSTR
jgi:Integrase zinc binding domain